MKQLLIFAVLLIISCNNKPIKKEIDKSENLIKRLSHWTDSKTIKPILYQSATIERLKKANQKEIKQFWDSIEKKGSPMVEKSDDTNSLIITFLYRDNKSDLKIYLDIKNLENDTNFGDLKFNQINKTDIWFKTLKIPKDWLSSYRYKIINKTAIINLTDKYNKNTIPIGLEKEYTYNSFDNKLDSSRVWFYDRKNIPKGNTSEYSLKSQILNNTHNIVVYKPYGYNETTEYPVIVIFDQFLYLERVPLPTILNNLIADNKIPPCIAVMVDNQPKERRELELPLYKPFADFVALELMPWAYQNFRITKNPNKSIIAGVSYGGLAASFIAYHYSNIFGNVLSQSGSYWRGKKVTDSIPWLIEQYKKIPKLPVRFYLDCGLQETVMSQFSNFNFLKNHRKMRDVLKSKGYEIYYQEFQGAHDWAGWRKTLPDGLIVLFNNME